MQPPSPSRPTSGILDSEYRIQSKGSSSSTARADVCYCLSIDTLKGHGDMLCLLFFRSSLR